MQIQREVVAIDVGGTKSFALLANQKGQILSEKRVENSGFKSPSELLSFFLKNFHLAKMPPLFLSLAGPREEEVWKLTNHPWSFSKKEIEGEFETKVFWMNDLEAMGHAIDYLPKKKLFGLPPKEGVKLVIAPGTGLGVAFVANQKVFPSEGGHITFSPENSAQEELFLAAKKALAKLPSYEHFLSGEGVILMAKCVGDPHAKAFNLGKNLTDCAKKGCLSCQKITRLYSEILGSFTRELSLMTLPFGGVFFMGSLLEKIDFVLDQSFYEAKKGIGPFTQMVGGFPLFQIADPRAAAIGLLARAGLLT